VSSTSDGRMTSGHLSLLETTIAVGSFCPSLLYYYCSNTVVATGLLSMATVVHDLIES
jgi:hypothetical protein